VTKGGKNEDKRHSLPHLAGGERGKERKGEGKGRSTPHGYLSIFFTLSPSLLRSLAFFLRMIPFFFSHSFFPKVVKIGKMGFERKKKISKRNKGTHCLKILHP
jgi:hypothetical protein